MSNASEPVPAPAPVIQAERITAMDTLRGFALLGILLMNIVGMGLYIQAYEDPTAAGGATGANLWAWAVMHVLADGKMRCLFSMVFGAGIILLTSRLERRGANSADVYYRRILWLMLFGVVHAYLLWMGDILYPYGLCALALYPFRKMSAKGLLITGAIVALLDSGNSIRWGLQIRQALTSGRAAVAAEQRGDKLTKEQEAAKARYEAEQRYYQPDQKTLEEYNQPWRGNFLSVVEARSKIVWPFHNQAYYSPGTTGWDIWSMMLIGMGLFKLGVFSGERSMKFYSLLCLISYGIGIPLNSWSAWLIIKTHFDPVVHSFANSSYDFGRLSVALGHATVIMIVCKAGVFQWLTSSLGAIGQMAFSGYVTQSIVGAFYFTGYGFKMFGQLQRYQLYYVVAAIWIFQLIVSPIWMRHFLFGPLEWCWRSLTYWKRQPMRRVARLPEVQSASA